MSDQKKKIGEGSYGCVYRPALKCANGIQIPDENLKVAKILKKDSGETEFNEYETISAFSKANGIDVWKFEKSEIENLIELGLVHHKLLK